MMRALLSILCAALVGLCLWAAEPPLPPALQGGDLSAPAPRRETRVPTDAFRELLAMSPANRAQALVQRPEANRNYLQAKLKEYEGLGAAERELRLRMVELRSHMLGLMQAAPATRAELLARVPTESRVLVEERLAEWDKLPAKAQSDLLENEFALDYFSRLVTGTAEQRQVLTSNLSPDRRDRLAADFARWNALPAEERERIHGHFQQFFELSEREQDKILGRLPPTARSEIQQTLDALEKLPADQRNRCLDALRKFTAMNPIEREEFLRNAERWRGMSPHQRDNWRDLVRQLPPEPPLPPGFIPPNAAAGLTPRR